MSTVPMHPEATADPQVVRWVIPAGTLPVVGTIARPPETLATLLDSGLVAAVEVRTQAVLIRLADGRSWSTAGTAVRDALGAALRQPEAWRPSGEVGEDDVLRAALQEVLDGAAGDYIRSHGGEVTIVSVGDRRAEVGMSGTCSHCPAAGFTLHSRLETELRERFPALVELRATESGEPTHPGRRRLPLLARITR